MRIEGLDLQEPVIGVAIAIQKLEPGRKAFHRREICLLANKLAIDDVLRARIAPRRRKLRRIVHLA
jgi:hypothetical protein